MTFSSTATTVSSGPRDVILAAAEARFRAHGFRKTTVAEIAAGANMSPANLYRHFDNKQQIGAACCHQWMTERLAVLSSVARRKGLTASERLREFLLENLRITHKEATDHPLLHEMVAALTATEPELIHGKVDAVVALIAEILAYGNESGEFDVDDVVSTARTVYHSQVVFEVPLFTHLYPYEVFELGVHHLSDLLVRGLARRMER